MWSPSCFFSETDPFRLAPITLRLTFDIVDADATEFPPPLVAQGHLDLDPLLLTRPSAVGTRGGVLVMERGDRVDLVNPVGGKARGQLLVRLRVSRSCSSHV